MSGDIGQTDYPVKHSGTLLVVGSAPCAIEDYNAARKLYPRARVMAINEAAGLVPCDFIASLHPEHMRRFLKLQKEKFGRQPTTHAAAPDAYFEAVDFYWHKTHTGGTSAWCGVLIGKEMGFTSIVLCGCPMVGGDGYAINTKTHSEKEERRFGLSAASSSIVRSHKAALADAVASGQGSNVTSMSGYTRELLGGPDGDGSGNRSGHRQNAA